MKLKGKRFDTPKPVDIFVNNGEEVVNLKAQAVLDYDEFEKAVPEPKPREIIKKGGKRSVDLEDPAYLKRVEEYGLQRTHYMMLKSLAATDGLEWEKVKIGDPSTWKHIEDELKSAFTPFGQARIMNGILQANGLDEAMLDQARESFLADRPRQSK